MGLLDDPQVLQGLMLMGGRKGQLPGLLQTIAQMTDRQKQRQLQEQSARQVQEMRDMQMAQIKQQQEAAARREQGLSGLMQQRPDLAPLLQLAPDKGIDRAFPEPVKPRMGFAPNGQAVDMNALPPGANFAKQPDWKDPAYEAMRMRVAAAGRPTINVNTPQETAFSKEMGKSYADQYTGFLKAGDSSRGELQELQRFENIISKVPTGKLEPIKSEVGKLASSLGFQVDTKKLGFQESLEALSNKFALTLRNPSAGAGMPGQLSDKDREFLMTLPPGLSKTREGNQILIEAFRRTAVRKAEVAQLARDYVKSKGTFDDGFYNELEKIRQKDMMSDLQEKAAALSGGGQVGGTTLKFDRNGNPI